MDILELLSFFSHMILADLIDDIQIVVTLLLLGLHLVF